VVRNHSKDSVIIFDHKSKYIKSKEPGFQKEAHGCLLGKEGGTEYLYLSDYERHVVVGSTLVESNRDLLFGLATQGPHSQ